MKKLKGCKRTIQSSRENLDWDFGDASSKIDFVFYVELCAENNRLKEKNRELKSYVKKLERKNLQYKKELEDLDLMLDGMRLMEDVDNYLKRKNVFK